MEKIILKYLGKLLLELIVVSVFAGLLLFGAIYLFGDKLKEILGGL